MAETVGWEAPKLGHSTTKPMLQKPNHEPKWEDIKHKLESWKKEAEDRGLREGERKGFENGEQKWQAKLKILQSMIDQLKQNIQTLPNKISPEINCLVLNLTKTAFYTELSINKNQIQSLVEEGLKLLKQDLDSTVLKINPQDENLLNLSDHIKDKIKIELLESVKTGGCILESNFTKIDASVEARWSEILKANA
ncbi:MAG: FliH/SctL family protein [Gammaproteobacteria bacterium]